MSSNRNNIATGRPFKPALSSERSSTRTPLTPRLAPTNTSTSRNGQVLTPRIKSQSGPNEQETSLGSDNVTPRSAKRRSRVESNNNTPTQASDPPSIPRANTVSPMMLAGGSTPTLNSLTLSRPVPARSPMSDTGPRLAAPFVRSPVPAQTSTSIDDDLDSRFFHASDISRGEADMKRPDNRKPAAFFYADGKQEPSSASARTTAASSVLQGTHVGQGQSELGFMTRSASPTRSVAGLPRVSSEAREGTAARSPPMLSPAISMVAATSPFFATEVMRQSRSPSPSKENIHLSYRKGASQIFGSRPSPIPGPRRPIDSSERRPSFQRAMNAHRKSTSLSSIDSELTSQPRRRSNTAQDHQSSSPLHEEAEGDAAPSSPVPDKVLMLHTSIETSPDTGMISPTKAISELAADARRERKVLDLEISNSSLLAINASLEREIRRQKAELKRFRRLSRAGRFSTEPLDVRRGSDNYGLSSLSEHDHNVDFAEFGPPSGLSELYDELSDSDEGSSVTSAEPGATNPKLDRLAKDDQRLRADLEKHRELLVQSQMMNQSIRRCMYATEELIKEGRKAVDYRVRVSDVRLGGRILTGHEDEDEDGDPIQEIEVEDEFDALSLASPLSNDSVQDHAQSFVKLWGGITAVHSDHNSDHLQSADRDSGIEMDRPAGGEVMASDPSNQK